MSCHYLLLRTSGQELATADQPHGLLAAEFPLRIGDECLFTAGFVAVLPGMESSVMVRVTLFFTLFVMLLGASGSAICQNVPPSCPGNYPAVRPCAPRQAVQPVARSVSVTVPMPQPPRLCGPPQCAPSAGVLSAPRSNGSRQTHACQSRYRSFPEACEQRCPIPVVYRDPGFLGPIIRNTVGLVGATIAAPFRVAEMLLPLDPPCPPRQAVRSSMRS